MKTLKFFIAIFATLILLNSCKKTSSILTPAIVGKWKDGGIKGNVVASFNGQTISTPLDEASKGEITEFKVDGSIAVIGSNDVAKYTTSGKQITISTVDADTKKTYLLVFNYDINGKTLNLTMDKPLFLSNYASAASAGVDLGFDLAQIKDLITSVSYTQTFEKQ